MFSWLAILADKASRDHFLSLEAPLIIRKISCYWEYLLSSGVPPIIRKISRLWEYLLSSGVPLIIGKTSRLREYLVLSERPFLVAPLAVDSHFCQTGSAISTDTQYGLMPIRENVLSNALYRTQIMA